MILKVTAISVLSCFRLKNVFRQHTLLFDLNSHPLFKPRIEKQLWAITITEVSLVNNRCFKRNGFSELTVLPDNKLNVKNSVLGEVKMHCKLASFLIRKSMVDLGLRNLNLNAALIGDNTSLTWGQIMCFIYFLCLIFPPAQILLGNAVFCQQNALTATASELVLKFCRQNLFKSTR